MIPLDAQELKASGQNALHSITASIVLYKNEPSVVQKAIESFLNTALDSFLFLIDNSPTDALRGLCNQENIAYIFIGSNLGFGAGHNVAIKKASALRSKYHLILNPDISFNPGTIEALNLFMDQHPDIGLAMPQILYPNGKPQYLPKLLPSPWSMIKRKLPLPSKLRGKILRRYELRGISDKSVCDCPFISGCFSFFRTSILEKAGGYDERFFMYFEDIDLSRRVHQISRTVVYPQVTAFHDYANGAQRSPKLCFCFIASMIKYFNKWGWIFDRERTAANKTTLEKVKSLLDEKEFR